MSEQIMLEFDPESLAIWGAALEQALIPAIAALEAFAIQLVAAFQPLVDALNGLGEVDFDWDKLELELTLENPERWEQESLVDWGKRLERAGLLDQLECRWMYQKECWRAVLHSPVWYAREAWEWAKGKLWATS